MLTPYQLSLYHLIWIALLWLLHSRRQHRAAAVIAVMFGALPRVYVALFQLPLAWRFDALGQAQLLAFYGLSVLWLVYLGCAVAGRPVPKLAFPMLVLSAVEIVAPASKVARLTISPPLAAQLVYCSVQFAFLRAKVRESEAPPPQWGRL